MGFRAIVIGGIIISIFASKINKFIGGIVSLGVTTFIFVYGLGVYAKPGWTLQFFGITVSQEFFVVLILIWYAFDFKQVYDGWKEGQLGRALQDKMGNLLRIGVAADDVMAQTAAGLENHDQSTRDLVRRIMQGEEFKQSVEGHMNAYQMDLNKAMINYKLAVDVINDLRRMLIKEGARVNVSINKAEIKTFVVPVPRIMAAKSISMTKKLNKNDLIFSVNNKLVASPEELMGEMGQVGPEGKVRLGVLFEDPNTRLWNAKTMEIKGAVQDLKVESNVSVMAHP